MTWDIPPVLTEVGGAGSTPAGAAWVARLPRLISRACARWGLQLGTPFGVGTAAWTAPGLTPDGTPVVLKITFPHDEATYEAAALTMWQGHAAVELLAHHERDWALLLRRAHPGTRLLDDTGDPWQQLRWCAQILYDLHQAPITNTTMPVLATVSAGWAATAAQRARDFAADLAGYQAEVEQGLALLHAFGTPGAMPAPTVVLHGDLNPGNVLWDAPSRRWLAIDPKPMLGDPAYDLWPVLAQIDSPFAYPDPASVLAARCGLLSQITGVPVRRTAEWGLARTVESALWQMHTWPQPDQRPAALAQLAHARVWAGLIR